MQWKEGKVYLEQEKRGWGWGCSLTFREFTLKSATGICLPLASVASSSSESVHHVCVIWPRIDLGQRKVLTDNQPKLICLLSAMFSVPLTVRLPVRCWIISFSWKVTFPSLLKLAVSVENPKKREIMENTAVVWGTAVPDSHLAWVSIPLLTSIIT